MPLQLAGTQPLEQTPEHRNPKAAENLAKSEAGLALMVGLCSAAFLLNRTHNPMETPGTTFVNVAASALFGYHFTRLMQSGNQAKTPTTTRQLLK